ncbi:MAG TPA: hypothetical protein VGY51_13530 [Acidimicrobiales bacterium]|nr:hypothetical protein [Acidimicrobiales bacterium]
MALLSACSSSASGGTGGPNGSVASSPPALTGRELMDGAGHACIVGGSVRPTVSWSQLANPILSYPLAGVKDEALIWAGGRWHMLFSYLTADASRPGGVSWGIATAASADLLHWSAASPWPRQAGVLGVASPDVVRDPSGGYLVTFQSDPGESAPPGTQDRLYYRTSSDLTTWSVPHPLAQSLVPSPQDRMIDGALVFTGHQVLLGFKYSSPSQPYVFEMARSTTGSLQGPWQLVGRPDITVNGDTIENYEFLTLAGRWRLVATSNTLDQPWLFTLAGDPGTTAGWLHWRGGYQLDIPSEAFNTGAGISSVGFEHANSAFVCDATSLPGHFYYAVYAGSTELTQFGGWGQAQIGVARSTDLVHWSVPPG